MSACESHKPVIGKKSKEISVSKKGKKHKKNKGKEGIQESKNPEKLGRKEYEYELEKLEIELVKLQGWIKHKGLKVVVIFEGRDSAGKGGTIKRITRRLSPRVVRVEALATPTEKEKSQFYFQRYVEKLPSAGEMVLFDRSWYNRAGVERVMDFCTNEEYEEFMGICPNFERALVRSEIILIKYWLHITDEIQEERFEQRLTDPRRRWKLSPMDLEARSRWVEYSKARDAMLLRTSTEWAPWYILDANIKRHARLNCISHLLSQIPYKDLTPEALTLPPRQKAKGYTHPDISQFNIVPAKYP
jgi:polyphosphate kinase 2